MKTLFTFLVVFLVHSWTFGQGVLPESVNISYGDSPTTSGLTVQANWPLALDGDFFISLNKGDGFAILTWNLGPISIGPSGGYINQVPWVAPYVVASHGPLSATVWIGPSMGNSEDGPTWESQWFLFRFGDLSYKPTDWFSFSASVLGYEDAPWTFLPAVKVSPLIATDFNGKEARFYSQVTLDSAAGWNPLFAIGVGVDL